MIGDERPGVALAVVLLIATVAAVALFMLAGYLLFRAVLSVAP